MEIWESLLSAYADAEKVIEAHCDLLYPCDLDCEHCYLDDKARPQRSTAFWKRVFDQLADMGVMLLTLSGGEIFLRKDLFELIAHARSRQLLVCLKTHGGFIGREEAERLAELGVSFVHVSYYSHRPDVHDAITRRPGSHAATWAALQHLAAAGLRVKVNMIVMQRNAADVPHVIRQCRDLGIGVAFSSEILSAHTGADTPLDVALSWEERAEYRQLVEDRTSACRVDSASNEWGGKRICGAGNLSIYIDPEGRLMPCTHWPVPLGELSPETPLAELVETSPFLARIRGAHRNADRHSCGSCAGKEVCHFCPGQSWHETRDPMAPASAICAETYGKVVAEARATGQPDPPPPPGLRSSPFRVFSADQAACRD